MANRIGDRVGEWIAEARRRRVFRTVGVYVVAVWGISSGGVDIAGVLGIPEYALRYGIYAAVTFVPVVVLLAWRFDIGRDGIVRDPQDVLAQQRADDELAEMPTIVGGMAGPGAVVVRWQDATGEQSSLFIDAIHLGRGVDCRVRFYDPLVSRHHARIFHEDDTWWIEDLGSRNGTAVDGEPIQRAPLPPKCEVRLNDAGPTLQVERIEAGAATQTAISSFPPGQPTAHVRLSRPDASTASRGAARS